MTFPNHLERALRDALGEIASGAYVDFDDENYPRLYRDVEQPPTEVLDELLHYGWLESRAVGSGYQLSPEGHRAYMRATDELQGDLVRPCNSFNPSPGSPHPENIARRMGWQPPSSARNP